MLSRLGLYPGEAFHRWFFLRVSSSINLEWLFSKLDSGFQSSVGFRILSAGFRIPKPRIPDSTSKNFLDSRIRILLHGANLLLHNLRASAICEYTSRKAASIELCGRQVHLFTLIQLQYNNKKEKKEEVKNRANYTLN